MIIIQELPSKTGNLRTNHIKDVVNVRPVDNYRLQNGLYHVVLCDIAGRALGYPIAHFASTDHRDAALAFLKDNLHKPVITLDYNEYFQADYLSSKEVKSILLKNDIHLFGALDLAIQRIFNNDEGANLNRLDAFTAAPPGFTTNIKLGISRPVPNINLGSLWAKTLQADPKVIHGTGVSRRAYWHNLILLNNESFKTFSSGDDYPHLEHGGL